MEDLDSLREKVMKKLKGMRYIDLRDLGLNGQTIMKIIHGEQVDLYKKTVLRLAAHFKLC